MTLKRETGGTAVIVAFLGLTFVVLTAFLASVMADQARVSQSMKSLQETLAARAAEQVQLEVENGTLTITALSRPVNVVAALYKQKDNSLKVEKTSIFVDKYRSASLTSQNIGGSQRAGVITELGNVFWTVVPKPPWWNENWSYCREVLINNTSNSDLADYQVLVANALYDENGLVGSWHFNEGSGTVAQDTSGNGRLGTLANGPTWVDGKFGKALSFDGVDDRVEISPSVPACSAFTVEMWIWFDSTGTNNWQVFHQTPNNYFYYKRETSQLYLSIWASRNGTGTFYNYALTYSMPNDWTHFVVVVNSDSTAQLYINGSPVSMPARSSGSASGD